MRIRSASTPPKRKKPKAAAVYQRPTSVLLTSDQYRQPFGEKATKEYGRPIGWAMFLGSLEKVGFPTALIIMLALQMWEPLAVTVLAEMVVSLSVLFAVAKGQRFSMLLKGIIVTPVRYVLMVADTFTMARFAIDLWITGNRKWRK